MNNEDIATSVQHGTMRGYTHFKCRCDECRAIYNAYARAYKAANREHLSEYNKRVRASKPRPEGMRRASALGDPMASVSVNSETGCWNWLGTTATKTGYGRFGRVFAHRHYYELFVGPIPAGLTIDHLCRNKVCVNPDHLETVTSRENTLRSDNPMAKNLRKTECNQGHALTEDNVLRRVTNGKEWRECLTCKRIWRSNSEARRRAKLAA